MIKSKNLKVISVILLLLALTLVFRTFLFTSYVVDGESMEPTLYDGNLMMVNKMIYDIGSVDRFDVIVFHANARDDYVKRVIGLPGDEIEYKDEKLYVNGEYVAEGFLNAIRPTSGNTVFTADFTLEESTGKEAVPRGKLFVMGDNRINSLDSRSFGFVSVGQLVGKVDLKYWPFSQMQLGFGN